MKEKLTIAILVFSITFSDCLRSQPNISVASYKGKSGFINEKGDWFISPDYEEVIGFAYGLAAVRKEEKWGYIDHRGVYIIEPEFDKAGPFMENGIASIEIEGTAYYLDIRGNKVSESDALVYSDQLALIVVDGKYGYIGRDYQWVIPPVFDKAWPFRDGNARVKRNNRWYYIDRSGYEVFLPARSRTFLMEDQPPELIRKRGKEKWGFASTDGSWTVPPVFDYVKSFSEGLAPVRIDNSWGYIDESGELVINASFEDASLFMQGLASVKIKGLYGCINRFGEQLIKPKYSDPLYFFPLIQFSVENEVFNQSEPSLVNRGDIHIPVIHVETEEVYVPEDKRLALVIGNSNYAVNAFLKNPVNDAADMADALRSVGFVVHVVLNSTQLAMKQAIDAFGKELQEYNIGLFYYSGHGIQAEGYNYLVPIDAAISSERDVEYTCVEAGRVLSRMKDAGISTNIIVLDACRDNPFEERWTKNSNGQGLAFMKAPSGSLVAYSTAPGTIASDGLGENGLYTSCLLKHIVTPGLSILEIFQLVRSEVRMISSDQQVPWESTSLEDNFYFIK